MSELDILIGDREITLRNDNAIVLRPCKVLQLRKILGLVNKYVEQLAKTEDAVELTKFILEDSGEQGLNDVFVILKSCSDLDDKKEDEQISFFNNLYYDELALLVTKFIEMNKDFFLSLGRKLERVVSPEDKTESKTGESK
ncbi:MAG: hypothetical protein AAGE96_05315 [Cyanobacteria bacterium P01_G01_bin.19]